MLQTLLLDFVQVKTWNKLQDITIKIRHIVYFLYWGEEIIKIVYNNIKIQNNYNIKWILCSWIYKVLTFLNRRG